MRAAGGEDRGQVEDVRAHRRDVVEVRFDPAQVSAEPLERRLRAAPDRELVPVPRDRPRGRHDVDARRRETVRKHLVHDGVEMPVGAAVSRRDHEVLGVGHVVGLDARGVQPRVPVAPACEEPAIRRHRIVDAERRPPPGFCARLTVLLRDGVARLAVVDETDRDPAGRRRVRHAEKHGRLVAELRRRIDDVPLGAVVVGAVEEDGHL